MNARTILNRQMNRTAPALAAAPVRVAWDQLPDGIRGFCTVEPYGGAYAISIDARLPIGRTYEVFLHETAHAFMNARNIRLPDQEAAAREIGGFWALWIAPRPPVGFIECMQWLDRLQHYHTMATGQPRRFYAGKNAGRTLPGMGIQ
jgi:hypothetical protein